MAKSVLDILIKLSKQGNADKETITGLVKLKSSFMDAAAVAGTLVAAGYAINKTYQATGGVFLDLAGKVRDTSRATSLSAEEASKTIQVTDDMGVSYETLAKAIKSSADSTDFSIEGLAKASKEYLSITDANERATYAQKLYGKSWVDMVGVLEKGPDVIKKNSDAVNKSLILTEREIKLAEENRIAIDNLTDTATAYAVTVGSKVVPAATRLIEGLSISNDLFARQHEIMASGEQTYSRAALYMAAIQMQQENVANTLDSATTSYMAWGEAAEAASVLSVNGSEVAKLALEAQLEAQKKINAVNEEFLGVLGSVQSAETSYQDNAKSLLEERARLEQERADAINQGYGANSDKVKEFDAALIENNLKARENATEHELANRKIILGLLERKLTADGVLDDRELQWLLDKGVAWGIYSQTVVNETAKAIKEANNLVSAINAIPTSKSFTMFMNMNSTNAVNVRPGSGRAKGTDGWETVPSGYPNDSYPIFLTSGEEFAVIPANGGGASSRGKGGGVGGSGTVNVTVNMNSVVSMADRESMKRLTPFIIDGIREAQAQGYIK